MPARFQPIDQLAADRLRSVRVVMTDIDDTLTHDGRLPAIAYSALENLQNAGFIVIPVTGRPGGWCDHIARMWPVDGIVGENGALYFRHDAALGKLIRTFWKSEGERIADRQKLDMIRDEVLEKIPGTALASDQSYRDADLAIDFREDVAPLSIKDIDRIVGIFEAHGAQAKVSSIHVNGWFGDYNKLAMTRRLLSDEFEIDIDAANETIVFLGDSPNDDPMFEFFKLSIGVANIMDFRSRLKSGPAFVTEGGGGVGFAEFAKLLLAAKGSEPD
jgi:HAD superfamily hydrolase (TIGR01484 family)